MDMDTDNIKAGKLAVAALRRLYEADKSNVYVNPRDLRFTVRARLPPYDGLYFRFEPCGDRDETQAILKAYGATDASGSVICDGASLAPDWPQGVVEGAGLHDPGYLEMDAIAEAWKDEPYAPGPGFARDWITRLSARGSPAWTPADVRQLMDAIFGDALRKSRARRWITRLYYTAVRLCGRLAHGRVTAVALGAGLGMSLLLGGPAGGCMAPPDIIDFPDGPPDIQRAAAAPRPAPADALRRMIVETFTAP